MQVKKLLIIYSFMALFFIFFQLFGIYKIEGNSMTPELKNNSLVVIVNNNKFNRKFNLFNVNRNDILIYRINTHFNLVKRCIGINGDSYQQILSSFEQSDDLMEQKVINNFLIPEHHYFMVGDNFKNSFDSRAHGIISEKEIIGKFIFSLK